MRRRLPLVVYTTKLSPKLGLPDAAFFRSCGHAKADTAVLWRGRVQCRVCSNAYARDYQRERRRDAVA